MGKEIASMIPESGKAKIKKAMLHPETELLPDPNRRLTGRVVSLSLYSSLSVKRAIISINKYSSS
jgi:hypothetical protein